MSRHNSQRRGTTSSSQFTTLLFLIVMYVPSSVFCVLFVCKCVLLPPGVNPIAVKEKKKIVKGINLKFAGDLGGGEKPPCHASPRLRRIPEKGTRGPDESACAVTLLRNCWCDNAKRRETRSDSMQPRNSSARIPGKRCVITESSLGAVGTSVSFKAYSHIPCRSPAGRFR
jgi:hypothetical protein